MMIRIIMKRIIQHNIKAGNLVWMLTETDRSKTQLQWLGPVDHEGIRTATGVTIKHEWWTLRHDHKIAPPSGAGQLQLPRCIGRAARIPDQHCTMAQLDDGAFPRGVEIDVIQTATGVQYQGPAGSTERGRDAASA